jgi:peptidoglycan hydrolase-like protein with peptidoglycan-binding domain
LPDWALDGLPPLAAVSAPPAAPIGWSPSGTIRKEADDLPGAPPVGSILWAQEKLVALKRPLALASGFECDGLNGPMTEAAVAAFQGAHGLTVDGVAGPQTLAALEAA